MPDLLLGTRYITIHYKDTLLVTDREGWIGEGRTVTAREISHVLFGALLGLIYIP